MVLACTLLIAVAQALIKTGAGALGGQSTLLETALGILTTPTLFAGYSLYGIVTVVMVLALRHAELSLIYPVIALSYVWVSILSVALFHEEMNAYKIAGVVVIISGVAVLGKGQSLAAGSIETDIAATVEEAVEEGVTHANAAARPTDAGVER